MPALVAGIHVLAKKEDVDGRNKSGHDGRENGVIGRKKSVAPEQADELALNAHAVGAEDARLVGGVRRLQRDRGALLAQALQRRLLLVDQRDDDVAGLRGVALADQREV